MILVNIYRGIVIFCFIVGGWFCVIWLISGVSCIGSLFCCGVGVIRIWGWGDIICIVGEFGWILSICCSLYDKIYMYV